MTEQSSSKKSTADKSSPGILFFRYNDALTYVRTSVSLEEEAQQVRCRISKNEEFKDLGIKREELLKALEDNVTFIQCEQPENKIILVETAVQTEPLSEDVKPKQPQKKTPIAKKKSKSSSKIEKKQKCTCKVEEEEERKSPIKEFKSDEQSAVSWTEVMSPDGDDTESDIFPLAQSRTVDFGPESDVELQREGLKKAMKSRAALNITEGHTQDSELEVKEIEEGPPVPKPKDGLSEVVCSCKAPQKESKNSTTQTSTMKQEELAFELDVEQMKHHLETTMEKCKVCGPKKKCKSTSNMSIPKLRSQSTICTKQGYLRSDPCSCMKKIEEVLKAREKAATEATAPKKDNFFRQTDSQIELELTIYNKNRGEAVKYRFTSKSCSSLNDTKKTYITEEQKPPRKSRYGRQMDFLFPPKSKYDGKIPCKELLSKQLMQASSENLNKEFIQLLGERDKNISERDQSEKTQANASCFCPKDNQINEQNKKLMFKDKPNDFKYGEISDERQPYGIPNNQEKQKALTVKAKAKKVEYKISKPVSAKKIALEPARKKMQDADVCSCRENKYCSAPPQLTSITIVKHVVRYREVSEKFASFWEDFGGQVTCECTSNKVPRCRCLTKRRSKATPTPEVKKPLQITVERDVDKFPRKSNKVSNQKRLEDILHKLEGKLTLEDLFTRSNVEQCVCPKKQEIDYDDFEFVSSIRDRFLAHDNGKKFMILSIRSSAELNDKEDALLITSLPPPNTSKISTKQFETQKHMATSEHDNEFSSGFGQKRISESASPVFAIQSKPKLENKAEARPHLMSVQHSRHIRRSIDDGTEGKLTLKFRDLPARNKLNSASQTPINLNDFCQDTDAFLARIKAASNKQRDANRRKDSSNFRSGELEIESHSKEQDLAPKSTKVEEECEPFCSEECAKKSKTKSSMATHEVQCEAPCSKILPADLKVESKQPKIQENVCKASCSKNRIGPKSKAAERNKSSDIRKNNITDDGRIYKPPDPNLWTSTDDAEPNIKFKSDKSTARRIRKKVKTIGDPITHSKQSKPKIETAKVKPKSVKVKSNIAKSKIQPIKHPLKEPKFQEKSTQTVGSKEPQIGAIIPKDEVKHELPRQKENENGNNTGKSAEEIRPDTDSDEDIDYNINPPWKAPSDLSNVSSFTRVPFTSAVSQRRQELIEDHFKDVAGVEVVKISPSQERNLIVVVPEPPEELEEHLGKPQNSYAKNTEKSNLIDNKEDPTPIKTTVKQNKDPDRMQNVKEVSKQKSKSNKAMNQIKTQKQGYKVNNAKSNTGSTKSQTTLENKEIVKVQDLKQSPKSKKVNSVQVGTDILNQDMDADKLLDSKPNEKVKQIQKGKNKSGKVQDRKAPPKQTEKPSKALDKEQTGKQNIKTEPVLDHKQEPKQIKEVNEIQKVKQVSKQNGKNDKVKDPKQEPTRLSTQSGEIKNLMNPPSGKEINIKQEKFWFQKYFNRRKSSSKSEKQYDTPITAQNTETAGSKEKQFAQKTMPHNKKQDTTKLPNQKSSKTKMGFDNQKNSTNSQKPVDPNTLNIGARQKTTANKDIKSSHNFAQQMIKEDPHKPIIAAGPLATFSNLSVNKKKKRSKKFRKLTTQIYYVEIEPFKTRNMKSNTQIADLSSEEAVEGTQNVSENTTKDFFRNIGIFEESLTCHFSQNDLFLEERNSKGVDLGKAATKQSVTPKFNKQTVCESKKIFEDNPGMASVQFQEQSIEISFKVDYFIQALVYFVKKSLRNDFEHFSLLLSKILRKSKKVNGSAPKQTTALSQQRTNQRQLQVSLKTDYLCNIALSSCLRPLEKFHGIDGKCVNNLRLKDKIKYFSIIL